MKETKRKLKKIYETKSYPIFSEEEINYVGDNFNTIENVKVLSFVFAMSRLLSVGNQEAEEITEHMLWTDLTQMKKFKNIDEAIENLTKIPNPLLIQCWRYKPNFKSVVDLWYKDKLKYTKINKQWKVNYSHGLLH